MFNQLLMGLGVCRKRLATVVDEVLRGEVYECPAPAHDEPVIKYVFDDSPNPPHGSQFACALSSTVTVMPVSASQVIMRVEMP